MKTAVFETKREVVAVRGPDATSFLQGQLSQDVAAVAEGGAAWSLLLDPQGKLVAIARVVRLADDTWLLVVDAGIGDTVVERLERFKLRTKADVARTDAKVLALVGDEGRVEWRGAFAPVDAGWPGLDAWDLIGGEVDGDFGSIDDRHRLRIEAGVPIVGLDVPVGALPHETSMVAAAVSFTKGCYTGQELVARVDSRGGASPRRLVRVAGLDGVRVPPGADLDVGGTVTSTGGSLGLAMVPRAVDVPSIAVAGGVEVVVEALPW